MGMSGARRREDGLRLSGRGEHAIYDAMLEYPIHHVLVRHEQGARTWRMVMPASGKVGVAMATSGPGATNLVTGIATAMMDSSPVVFITGQVASASDRLRCVSGRWI